MKPTVFSLCAKNLKLEYSKKIFSATENMKRQMDGLSDEFDHLIPFVETCLFILIHV